MKRRVVITGLGAITPVGNNVNDFWNSIKEGRNGIDVITHFDTSDFKVKLAAEVKDFKAENYMDRKQAKRMDRFSQFAIAATKEALLDSKLDLENYDKEKISIIFGSGIGGIETIQNQIRELKKQIHDIKNEGRKEFESILTDKQLKKLEKLKAEAEQNFKKHMPRKDMHRPHPMPIECKCNQKPPVPPVVE